MLRSRTIVPILARIAAMSSGAVLCISAVVGCGGAEEAAPVTGGPTTTAIETKGAAAKEQGLPPGVMPSKGKMAP